MVGPQLHSIISFRSCMVGVSTHGDRRSSYACLVSSPSIFLRLSMCRGPPLKLGWLEYEFIDKHARVSRVLFEKAIVVFPGVPNRIPVGQRVSCSLLQPPRKNTVSPEAHRSIPVFVVGGNYFVRSTRLLECKCVRRLF